MDANAYMDQLKEEAQSLRTELANIEQKEMEKQVALLSSISGYVSSLPSEQLRVIQSNRHTRVAAMSRKTYRLLTFDIESCGVYANADIDEQYVRGRRRRHAFAS